jgi:hypothetical protein
LHRAHAGLSSQAAEQGDPRNAAILALREAETALQRNDALTALRIAEEHVAMPGLDASMRRRLAVLHARALSRLGRDGQAAAELRALLSAADLPPDVELDAILEKAEIALRAGKIRRAGRDFRRAEQLAAEVRSPEKEVLARIGLGRVAMHQGRTEEARNALARAATDAQSLGDEALLATANAAQAEMFDRARDSSSARRLLGQEILSHEELLQLHAAAVSAGLDPAALIAAAPAPLAASFPQQAHPHAQLLSDLHELNRVGRIAGGQSPLRTWLQTAASLAEGRPEASVFRAALAKLGGAAA